MPEHGAAVAVGGAIGSLGRTGVGLVVPDASVGTLLVNVTGAFLLGLLLGRATRPVHRALLGTGVLGAWTTFSAFAVELDTALRTDLLAALLYLLLSVGGGLLAARLGQQVAT